MKWISNVKWRSGDFAAQNEAALLCTVRECAKAARRSSVDVWAALDASIRRCVPTADAVLIFAPEVDQLRCIFCSGARSALYRSLRIRRDDISNPVAIASRTRNRVLARPFVSAKVSERYAETPTLIAGDRSGIAMAMIEDATLHAMVYVSSNSSDISAFADLFAELIGCACIPYILALERERDRTSASHDHLTGLLGPRAFRTRFHEHVARIAERDGGDLSLWFIDTDTFKQVNDTLGHPAGDLVLQQIAEILRAHAIPEIDVPARNGGDEFCVLASGASKTRAIERADAFRRAVRAHDFGIGVRLTVSVGVASYPYDGRTSSELLERADGAMYHSKRSGRDRVSFAVSPGRFEVYAQ